MLVVPSAGLAALGVLNGQLLATLERAKEPGIARALGASRGQPRRPRLDRVRGARFARGLLGIAVGAALVPLVVTSVQSLSGLDLVPRSGPWSWPRGLPGPCS
ncbi:MAG: hypothetical protein R3F17_02040 [Planctomycetota bacterium]